MGVGHADAAVHLNHLVGRQMHQFAGLGLGERRERAAVGVNRRDLWLKIEAVALAALMIAALAVSVVGWLR